MPTKHYPHPAYTVRLLATLGAFSGLCASTAAWAITPPGTPPTFYCDANRPVDADTVEDQFNTRTADGTATAVDRGNQPRWEYGSRVDVGTGNGAPPTPDALPNQTWTFFTGHELDRYLPLTTVHNTYPGIAIGHYPAAGTPQLEQFGVHYFRYRFKLDDSVDPASYAITIPQGLFAPGLPYLRVDDYIQGVYVNGAKVAVAPSPLPYTLGGAALPNQWKAGENELVLAIQNTSVGGAVWLNLQKVEQTACTVLPDTTLAPPAAVTTDELPSFSGSTSNAAPGATVTVVIKRADGTTAATLTTTIDASGNYTVAATDKLPAGAYTIEASVAGDTTPATQPLTVTAAATPDTTLNPPANVTTDELPSFSGSTSNAAPGATVTVVIKRADGTIAATLSATTDASGNYTVAATDKLPAGTYTIEASVAGDTTPATQPLTVTAAAIPDTTLNPPANVTTDELPSFSGSTSNAAPGATVTVVIKRADGTIAATLTATTDASGNYTVAATDKLPAGAYTIEASVAGDTTPATQPLTVTAAATPDTTLPPPAAVSPDELPTFSGSTSNAAPGATVTVVIKRPDGTIVETLTTTTDASGNYTVTATNKLPAGTYTIEASVAGDTTPATASLVVRSAPLINGAVPVPTLGHGALGLLSLLLMGVAAWRRKRF
ncbi:IPTL-CTERM sorting domain-containing protein [Vandammella animalimorsus]|uniref:IPTL-CTERM sorting domain-containing protein n=1 Tax=Vandammella animalimorsus TaxID=2029117 RepID=A0A3M6RI30_9BURK|nr:IPTL-CTERM sorting domain-containing protein [Vandammella animalimorsus]RMX14790.1 IPTL-CTERM sorting domain-containing protein [Vandammella animalimorsus]